MPPEKVLSRLQFSISNSLATKLVDVVLLVLLRTSRILLHCLLPSIVMLLMTILTPTVSVSLIAYSVCDAGS